MTDAKKCPVCGIQTLTPIRAALEHFRLYEKGYWKYMRGNMIVFGKVSGFISTCYLAFPWLNTLVHWKYRKDSLVADVGGVPVPLEKLFDENGCALKDVAK